MKRRIGLALLICMLLSCVMALTACDFGSGGGSPTLSRIEITAQPTKTVYLEGENFDPAGMEVTAYYSDESTAIVTGYSYTTGAIAATQTTVTVTYNGQTATVPITVYLAAQTPVITAGPQGGTVYEGVAYSLSVTANVSDGGTLSYQWFSSGGVIIEGATNATFSVPTDTAGTVSYYCTITNTLTDSYGVRTKAASTTLVTVRVNARTNAQAPNITTQPQGVAMSEGQTYKLTVAASIPSGGGTLSYQWYKNTGDNNTTGTAIAGATATTYSLQATVFGTAYYYCVVTNTISDNGDGGIKKASTATNAVAVRLIQATAITVSDVNALVGASFMLTASLTPEDAGNTVTFELVSNTIGAILIGNQVSCYTLGSVTYKATIGSLESNTATITFGVNPAYGTIITTAAELNNIRNALNGKYQLGNDIDLGGYANWTPIGEIAAGAFTGQLDGNGFTIRNLTINSLSVNGVGLFGNIGQNGAVRNLKLENVNITAGTAGGIAGVSGGKITGCQILSGTIGKSNADYVGGIVGKQTITYTYVNSAFVFNNLDDNVNYATVIGNDYVGGIAGIVTVTSINSSTGIASQKNVNHGNVSGAANVGGIAGQMALSSGSKDVREFENHGAVSGVTKVGGIVGNFTVSISASSSMDSYISVCLNDGGVTASGNYAGGIVGIATNASDYSGTMHRINIRTSENEGTVQGVAYVGGIAGQATYLSTNENRGEVVATGSAVFSVDSRAKAFLGGIAGSASVLSGNKNYGDVTYMGSGDAVGGIVGWLTYVQMGYQSYGSSMTNNINYADITSNGGRVGGVAGEVYWWSTTGKIEGCTNEGVIIGISNIGGIAGYISATSSGSQRNSQIVSSVNRGNIIGSGNNIGGIAGYATGANASIGVNQGPNTIQFISCENHADVWATQSISNSTIGGILGCAGIRVQPQSGCANTGVIHAGNGHQLMPPGI